MRNIVVTDNTVEKIEIKDCGEGFAYIHNRKGGINCPPSIWNSREANEIANFIKERK